jgi:hypothetical protein
MIMHRSTVAVWGASVFLLATLPAVAAKTAADAAGLAAIERCVARLDPIADIGFERVAARCPELPAALDAASWSALLPPNWRTRGAALSRDGLIALAALVTERESARPERVMPDPQKIQQTLADVGAIVDDRSSLWERVKRWLRDVFARSQEGEREGMLRRMFGPIDVSEAISRALAYAGYALLVAFACFVVLQELRAAGLLDHRRRRQRTEVRQKIGAVARLELTDVMAAPLAERPGLLLRMLAEVWRTKLRPDPTSAMTATEFSELVRAAVPSAAAEVAALARTADAVRYGGRSVPDSDLSDATRGASALLEALRAAPAHTVEKRGVT